MTIKGDGIGGRNQEMLLAFVKEVHDQVREGRGLRVSFPFLTSVGISLLSEYKFSVLSAAFDGIEGNSPATGALVDNHTFDRLLGMVRRR